MSEPFTPAQGRALLGKLREAGRGALVITSGLRDLRLVIGTGDTALEAVGLAIGGTDGNDLIRAFLCALFWEDPLADFDPDANRREGVAAIVTTDDPEALVQQIEQGLTELEPLREKVPSLEVQVTVTGQPPPPTEDAPAAKLFRAAHAAKGVVLAAAADEARIDPIDAAWAAVDLLEAKQATIKKLPPTAAMRRLKRVEGLADDGLIPGLRWEYLARGHSRADPRKAAAFYHQAGDAYRFGGRIEVALACYRSCLEHAPDDLGALEGILCAQAALGDAAEVKVMHAALAQKYAAIRLPLRAKNHLQELPDLTGEQRALLLDCLLAAGEFDAAAQQAERMAAGLSSAERLALAERFQAAGATGAALARVVRSSGVQRLVPLRRALLVLVAVSLLVLGGLLIEAYARTRHRAAVEGAQADLARGRFEDAKVQFAELTLLAQRLQAKRWPLPTCLAEVDGVARQIDDLAADQRLVDESRATLAWRGADDILAADEGLQALAARGKTPAFQALIKAQRDELAAFRAERQKELDQLEAHINNGAYKDALELARDLLMRFPNARAMYASRFVPARIVVTPKESNLLQDGKLLQPLARDSGQWEVRVPLDDRPLSLEAQCEGWVSQRFDLRFGQLREPEVIVDLIRLQKEPTLPWPTIPEAPDRVRFVEDPRTLGQLRAQVRGALETEEQVAQKKLEALLTELAPTQRLIIVALSEPQRRRVHLREVTLFLEQGDRRATPYRLEVGRLDRELAETATTSTLRDLTTMDRWPVLLEAIRAAVLRMQGELGR